MRKIAGYLTKNRSEKDQKIAQSTHENGYIKTRKTFWRNSKQLLTEEQFCKIVGRLRLYQFLPVSEQRRLPSLQIGDQAVNAMVKGYVSNPDFGKEEGEEFTCWNLLQLATEAVKSAYINCWLERNQNCTDFAVGIQNALRGNDTEGYGWFLS